MLSIGNEIAALAASFVCAIALTPLVGRISFRLNVVDHPDERRRHAISTPRLGGIALLGAFFIGALVFQSRTMSSPSSLLKPVMLVAPLAFVLGLWDDLLGIGAKRKLLGQLILGILAFAAGFRLEHIWLGGDVYLHTGPFSLLVTMLWIAAVMNAINLIDGLDGLATGICGLIFMSLAVLSAIVGSGDVMWFSLFAAGACFGFLLFNFPPAKIFMGDSGSMFLGFLIAVLSMSIRGNVETVPVYAPLLFLAVPFADTFVAILRRAIGFFEDIRGRKHRFSLRGLLGRLSSADGAHIHHRLLDNGFSRVRAVSSLYFFCAISCAIGIFLNFVPAPFSWVIVIMALYVAWHLILSLDYVEFMPRRLRIQEDVDASFGQRPALIKKVSS